MTSARNVIVLDTQAALAMQGAIEFQTRSHAAIKDHGHFTVALSGGGTPKAMLELLSGTDFAEDITWGAVHVFWGDERCVPPDNANSNYRMAVAALLSKVSLPAANIHRMHGELEPHEGSAEYNEQLRAFFAGPTTFDLTFLGLGPDGHTASLFPRTAALAVTDEHCAATFVGEKVVSPWRLTLTYPALNASRAAFFMVEGASKANVVAEVINGLQDPQRLPSQGIAPAGTLTWLLDKPAASKLNV